MGSLKRGRIFDIGKYRDNLHSQKKFTIGISLTAQTVVDIYELRQEEEQSVSEMGYEILTKGIRQLKAGVSLEEMENIAFYKELHAGAEKRLKDKEAELVEMKAKLRALEQQRLLDLERQKEQFYKQNIVIPAEEKLKTSYEELVRFRQESKKNSSSTGVFAKMFVTALGASFSGPKNLNPGTEYRKYLESIKP